MGVEYLEITDEEVVAWLEEQARREGVEPFELAQKIVREHLGVKPVRYRARWRGDGRGQAWRRWLAEEVRELRRQGFVCRFAENHRTDSKPKNK